VHLSELEVLIVDCQTTGASPAHGVVLEIGWGRCRADSPLVTGLEVHWLALPEGTRVDAQVRKLTGFDEAAVTRTLEPLTAWQRLSGSSSGAERIPTAIHFAKFELSFLRDWAARFEPERAFPLDAVCVHAIACRLYPDLPRRSLRALAGFLGHGVTQARQSLAHVEATAFIWHKLVAELASRGVDTWSALGEWLAAHGPAPARAKKRRYPLPRARWLALPDAPGVYRMLRSNGDVLYVGKAASLKKRVASHFSSSFSRSERALELLSQVHELDVTPTASAAEAALLENEEIKVRAPPYNVQLVVTDPRVWFVDAALDEAVSAPDDGHRRGPLPSTYSVRGLGAIRALCRGEAPSVTLRARAVGTRERWAPDEVTFAEGFALLSARQELKVATGELERTLERAARRLLAAPRLEAELNEAAADTSDVLESSPPGVWDAERVVRHLERSLAHGYQLLQRARWLCLLHDSVVCLREPGADSSRLLTLSAGRLAAARDGLLAEIGSASPSSASRRERQASFDRAQYDRLRTLTSELKRVLRDGGSVEVLVGRRSLSRDVLERLLRWV
jgi:DNA polymerase III epsilon subunit-like protein